MYDILNTGISYHLVVMGVTWERWLFSRKSYVKNIETSNVNSLKWMETGREGSFDRSAMGDTSTDVTEDPLATFTYQEYNKVYCVNR